MTIPGSTNGDGPADKIIPPKKGLGLSPIQVISGGAAAAVASVVGGHLGLAGTVVGAFFISIVSGIALPLFRTSLEKSHEQIQRVVPRRGAGATRTKRPQTSGSQPGPARAISSKISAALLPLDDRPGGGVAGARQASGKSGMGRKAWMALGGTAAVFVIGVGSILGLQAATGVPLSPGTSALHSGISRVVTNVSDSMGTPAPDPKPSAPVVEPSARPTDPGADPAEQPPTTPAPASEPAPSTEPATPPAVDTPAPSDMPSPTAGTSDSGVPADGSQIQPGNGISGGDAPAK